MDAVTDKVPPKVKFPVVVTVPLNVNPLTVPVPPTLVTVPFPFPVPAPIAVLNAAASKADTVLSEKLTLKNLSLVVTFGNINKFAPTVVAPRLVLAFAAVVAPVPPFAIATVPVTLVAFPVTFPVKLPENVAAIVPEHVTIPGADLYNLVPVSSPNCMPPVADVGVPVPICNNVAGFVAPIPTLPLISISILVA